MDIHYTKKIDYKSLLKYCFNFKKKIIIFGIVGAIVVGVMAALFGSTKTDDLADAESNLSQIEVSNTQSAYKSLKSLSSQIDNLNSLVSNSTYFNFDYSKAKKIQLIYNISDTKKSNEIANAYSTSLKNDVYLNTISKILGKKLNSIDSTKLVQIYLDTNNSSNVSLNISENSDSSINFNVAIYGSSQNVANSMKVTTENRINELTKTFKKKYGDYKIVLASDIVTTVKSSDIAAERATYSDQITSLYNSKVSMTNTLNDNEKAYLDALNKNNKTSKSTISYRNIIINLSKGGLSGFIIFAALVFAYYAVKYIANDLFRNNEEILSINNTKIIEEVDKKTDLNLLNEEIKLICGKRNIDSIGLVSSCEVDKIVDVLDKINVDKRTFFINGIPKTVEEFNNLMKSNHIILIEKKNVSHLNQIVEIEKYYINKDIKIEGALIINE